MKKFFGVYIKIDQYKDINQRNKILLTGISLLTLGIFIGVVSLYFGASYYSFKMFLSYFLTPYTVLLNILPVILLIYLFYFITNRIWIGFMITTVFTMAFTLINYYKLLFRNDPLLAADLSLFSESMNMVKKYYIQLNWKIILAIVIFTVLIVASAFVTNWKVKSIKYRLLGIAIVIILGFISYRFVYTNNSFYTATENNRYTNKWSSTGSYISRGFIYPFICSIKTSIVKAPTGYDKKVAEKALDTYGYSNIPDSKKVNVISIMLESYNDFSKFDQLDFNIDVYKYFHALETESYSGQLITDVFAGGTVRTERSFLTGFTLLPNFRKDTNSYVRYFKEQGYTTEGSHPGYDWFYNRKNVNEYFGFENYYFYENYYSLISKDSTEKDSILFPQIIKLYEANKKSGKPYFSFNVTYQNHGPYSLKKITDTQYIKNKGYTDEEYNILNNYFSGIYETTNQIQDLVEYFRVQQEPVVVILFGDHNPWLGDNNSVYKKLDINLDFSTKEGFNNYYNTPYIIWGNDNAKKILGNDLKGSGLEISPCYLMNQFFDLASYDGNEFMKYTNLLESTLEVMHVKNYYKEKGVFTSKLSVEGKKKLYEFMNIQYYWLNNISKD